MIAVTRRETVSVDVAGVAIGGGAPVVVQSMTNTDTADVQSTVDQIRLLADAGSQLVRVTVNNDEAAQAVPEIVSRLRGDGYSTPIVGDFHYNGHLLLTKYPKAAEALAKLRINPGNVGTKRRDENFTQIIKVAIEHDKPVRIGVNWGSLDQRLLTELMDANALEEAPKEAREVLLEAMVESALRSAALAEETGLGHDRIVISAKVSTVRDLIAVYRMLARRGDYPLHVGLTEAGLGIKGIVATTAGLAPILLDGIGDTIRVSLTPAPGGDRAEEVRVAQQVLQSLGIRHFEPQVTSCPGWRAQYPGVEEMDVAVMGCVVNGPGESKHANIGISLPGTFEDPKAPVYIDGEHSATLKGDGLVDEFKQILSDYVKRTYAPRVAAGTASEE